MAHEMIGSAVRRSRVRPGGAGLASVVCVALLAALFWSGAPGVAAAGHPAKVDVDESCVAPANPPFNACSITGSLPGAGIDQVDVEWVVTLFHGAEWRIQFQAFSEEVDRECQYPIRVKGAYEGDGLGRTTFNSTLGLALGLSPEEHPELTLLVDTVRIRTGQPTCD